MHGLPFERTGTADRQTLLTHAIVLHPHVQLGLGNNLLESCRQQGILSSEQSSPLLHLLLISFVFPSGILVEYYTQFCHGIQLVIAPCQKQKRGDTLEKMRHGCSQGLNLGLGKVDSTLIRIGCILLGRNPTLKHRVNMTIVYQAYRCPMILRRRAFYLLWHASPRRRRSFPCTSSCLLCANFHQPPQECRKG